MHEQEHQSNLSNEEYEAMRLGYPYPLAKATVDNFDYALKTKSGCMFRFSSATAVNDKWVIIEGGYGGNGYQAAHPRGTYIRLDEIVWVADAPEGS